MKKIGIEKQIVLIFLLFTAFFTLFRSSMSGIFHCFMPTMAFQIAQSAPLNLFKALGS